MLNKLIYLIFYAYYPCETEVSGPLEIDPLGMPRTPYRVTEKNRSR